MKKIVLTAFVWCLCASCVIQKEVIVKVDKGSTAKVEVNIKGSDLEDVSASAEAALVP